MTETYDSASDVRAANNNIMRHQYRTLSDREKEQMRQVKDKALELYELIASIGDSRELSLAKTRIEEGVMWAIKDITS